MTFITPRSTLAAIKTPITPLTKEVMRNLPIADNTFRLAITARAALTAFITNFTSFNKAFRTFHRSSPSNIYTSNL
jgi:hypothetical protein